MKNFNLNSRPFVVTVIGSIFLFGVFASCISLIALLTPDGPLEIIWQLKPQARISFSAMGYWATFFLSIVCLFCAASAYGFFKGTVWGYRLGLIVLILNLIGDILSYTLGIDTNSWIGIPIVGILIWLLLSTNVKKYFKVNSVGLQ